MDLQNKIKAAAANVSSLRFDAAFKSLFGRQPTPVTGQVLRTYGTLPGSFPSALPGTDGSPFLYESPGDIGLHQYFQFKNGNSAQDAYERCPPLAAIINRKAQAYINGKTWIMNSKGKESQSPEAKKLRALFKNPNVQQTWNSFEAQGYIYQQIFGYNIVLPIKPVGYDDNIDATAVWNIPPYMLDIEETKKLFYQTDTKGIIGKIVLNYKGVKTALDVNEVFIMKDFTPSFDSLILPQSRIKPLAMPINNIIGAYEARNVLINYRGALGAISPEGKDGAGIAVPLKEDNKADLQEQYARYGIKGTQWRFIISTAAIKWQQMGYATKDLMLFEEVVDSAKEICDAYGYPPHLLGLIDPTFNNQMAAQKHLYQDTMIPEAQNIYEQWATFFRLHDRNETIDKDFSHVACLQEDRAQQAQARYTLDTALKVEFENGLITLNDWLIELGRDPLPAELGDIRATDRTNTNVPLAVTIGVGGVQGLITVLTAPGLTQDARVNTLMTLFGLGEPEARGMVSDPADAQQTETPIVVPASTETETEPVTTEAE